MELPSRKTSLVTMKCAGPHCSLCDGSPLLDLNTRSLDNASMLNCFKRQIPPPKHCVVGLLKEHMLSTLFTFTPTTGSHLLLPESYFRKLFVILVVLSTNLQSSTNRHHLKQLQLVSVPLLRPSVTLRSRNLCLQNQVTLLLSRKRWSAKQAKDYSITCETSPTTLLAQQALSDFIQRVLHSNHFRQVSLLRTSQIVPEPRWRCSQEKMPLKSAKTFFRTVLLHSPKRRQESKRERLRPRGPLLLCKIRFQHDPPPCLHLCSLKNRVGWSLSNRHSREEERHLPRQPLFQYHNQRMHLHHSISKRDKMARSTQRSQRFMRQHLSCRTPIQPWCMPGLSRHLSPINQRDISQQRQRHRHRN